MAEDRIVKFCARVGPRSISLVMINYPQVGVVKVTWRNNFLANKCQYLENGARERYTYDGRLIGNRIWPIKWKQRQWPRITLKVAGLFKCNPLNICAARSLCVSWPCIVILSFSYSVAFCSTEQWGIMMVIRIMMSKILVVPRFVPGNY